MTRAAKPLLFALCAAWSGCSDGGPKDIEYSSMETTLGRWPAKSQQGTKNSPGLAASGSASETPSTGDAATDSGEGIAADGDAGSDDPPSAGTNGSLNAGAQSKPQPTADAGKAAPARLTFSVLTQVHYMRVSKSDPAFDDFARGPKNMGAIWVSKPDGSFVRSLQLWRLHEQRKKHLVDYNKVCDCPKPDVTATATLMKHREHVASWDMTDRNGAAVPEGPYTLHIEVADYDVADEDRKNKEATNAHWSIDFDTKSAPSTIMPEPPAFFTGLKLELLKP